MHTWSQNSNSWGLVEKELRGACADFVIALSFKFDWELWYSYGGNKKRHLHFMVNKNHCCHSLLDNVGNQI